MTTLRGWCAVRCWDTYLSATLWRWLQSARRSRNAFQLCRIWPKPVSVKLHLNDKRRNGQRDKRSDARNRTWWISALKCDIFWQYFNDFPDNQLTTFRVCIGWFRIFTPSPLKFLLSLALSSHVGWTPLADTTDRDIQTDKQTNEHVSFPFVRLCLRWSLTLTARCVCRHSFRLFVYYADKATRIDELAYSGRFLL